MFDPNLPEVQEPSPHFSFSSPKDPDNSSFVQSEPPWAGMGWLQALERLLLPPPQEAEQVLHSLHSDQPPLISGVDIIVIQVNDKREKHCI